MKKSSNPVTKEMVLEVKAILAQDLYDQHHIAILYNVNQGRISEIKNGHYDYLYETIH